MDDNTSLNKTDLLPSDAATEIFPLAISAREDTEAARKIAPTVVKQLSESALFRMGLPKSLGGWEGNPVETLKVYETLASAESSVAWIVWNNHLACTFGRFLDESSMKEIYNDPSHVYANSARPEGVATVVDNGYMVSGRWTLVSGCELADWFVLRCLVVSEGSPTTLGPGANLKLFFIPKTEVEVIDTWNVGGLNGTGSHDIVIKDAFVKEAYAVGFDSPVAIDNAYSRLPIGCINAAGCAAMSLGVLKAAMDDLIDMCLERVTPGKSPDLRDRATVQAAIAKSTTLLASRRLQLHNSVETLWDESQQQNTFTDVQLADVWAASCEAAREARAMVSEIYAVAGTASLYKQHRIERAHRDIHAILQHGIVQPHWMNQAGMAYVGLTPNAAMFRV
ncbi:acyl-CoA dehydrogenase family protein [Psychrobacter fozii]|uniref:Alkylation response protein AidB-like acyl-CoA dehydrogenase n=1 Tax=Psychrobacter fozii TaxID=198480 RepID=A0A2V4V2V6_9GAMM|nr:acyl-CoA dehydrogenase family protein [Psychrobacter fozii]PYE39200.1 alkylation response protein AidB-like acyl-CoA dehydrogenase [Psychrobacter fozii]